MARSTQASRRAVLKGLAAAGTLALPGRLRAQGAPAIKIVTTSQGPLLINAVSMLAEGLGYYKEEGLNVEFLGAASGSAAMTIVVSGSANMGIVSPADIIPAVMRGQKLKGLMATANYNPFSFVVSKDYAASHDIAADMSLEKKRAIAGKFKGIRCGVTAPGSESDRVMRLALTQFGLNPDTDAKIIPMGTTSNSMAALSRGALDGFMASPPTPELTVAQFGAIPLFSVGKNEIEGVQSIVAQVLLARTSEVEKSPALFEAIVRAGMRAFRYLHENVHEAGELVYRSRFENVVPKNVWPAVWDNNISVFRTPNVTAENIEGRVKLGMVPNVTDPKDIKTNDFVDMHFVSKAAKDIGWQVPAS